MDQHVSRVIVVIPAATGRLNVPAGTLAAIVKNGASNVCFRYHESGNYSLLSMYNCSSDGPFRSINLLCSHVQGLERRVARYEAEWLSNLHEDGMSFPFHLRLRTIQSALKWPAK